jgi:hypothetical protein
MESAEKEGRGGGVRTGGEAPNRAVRNIWGGVGGGGVVAVSWVVPCHHTTRGLGRFCWASFSFSRRHVFEIFLAHLHP